MLDELGGVKAVVPQRLWPVLPQIDGDLTTLGAGLGFQAGEHRTLEIEDLRLVRFRRSSFPPGHDNR